MLPPFTPGAALRKHRLLIPFLRLCCQFRLRLITATAITTDPPLLRSPLLYVTYASLGGALARAEGCGADFGTGCEGAKLVVLTYRKLVID